MAQQHDTPTGKLGGIANEKDWVFVPVVALLAGFALRVHRLGVQSMWFDEASRLLEARADLSFLLGSGRHDTLPPFYHVVTHFWQRLGDGDFWLRLPPAFASLVLVAVVYRLARDVFDRRTAVLSMIMMTLFPYQVFHAQQANLYSYLALLSGLQVVFFWSALREENRFAWIGYGLSAVIGLYTHYYAAFVTVTLHLWLLSNGRRYREHWKSVAITDGFVILAALPLSTFFLDKLGEVSRGFWLARPNLLTPLSTLHLFTVSYSLPEVAVPIAFLLVAMAVTLTLVEIAFALKRDSNGLANSLLIVMLAFLPILMLFLISLLYPVYLERTLIIVTPAYAILLARGLAICGRRSPLPYISALLLLLLFISLIGYYYQPEFAKPGYRPASAYVAARQQPGDLILHTGNGSYIPFLRYISPEDHYLLDGDPEPHHPPLVHEVAGGRTISQEEIGEYERVWLVVALEHSIDYQRSVVASFDRRYPLIADTVIGDVIIRLYDLSRS